MEAYTAEEIKEILEEEGLLAVIQTDEYNFVTIDASAGDAEWYIILGREVSPYQCMQLCAMTLVDEDPLMYANEWNSAHTGKVVAVQDDETCSIKPTKNGKYLMTMTWFVPFFGSVSPAYLSYVICHWHDEVCELLGLEELTEETDRLDTSEHEPIDRLSQIELELQFKPRQSSRELARSLKTIKYEINNLLYRHTHIFEKDGVSPPLWSNRSNMS